MKTNSPPISATSLTRTPLLAKNSLINLAGYGLPALVALFAIPRLVTAMGTERFGLLSLSWVLIGYLSLLDLGLGRALTKVVAEKIGEEAPDEIPSLIWNALAVMLCLSILATFLFWGASTWLVDNLLKISTDFREEAYDSLKILGIFVPVVIVSVGLRGILEAYQRFDLVNAVRLPLGIFSFAVPLAVVLFLTQLPATLIALLILRIIGTLVQFLFCYRIVEGFLAGISFRMKSVTNLLRFGGWMTITNVVYPILVQVDRFFIGSMLSVAAVAYYSTPSDAITNLSLISASLMGVMFPAFSATYRIDLAKTALLLGRSLKVVFIVMFPLILIVVVFAFEGLEIWLNDEFANSSYRVAQMIAIGVFFLSLGQMPYAMIQGAGRPDLCAKFHICELPVFILLLFWAIRIGGINGAAFIWMARAAIDTLYLYFVAQRLLFKYRLEGKSHVRWLLIAITLFIMVSIIPQLIVRILICALVLLSFLWYLWRNFLLGNPVEILGFRERS